MVLEQEGDAVARPEAERAEEVRGAVRALVEGTVGDGHVARGQDQRGFVGVGLGVEAWVHR
jgi:hypothetical protein